MERKGNAIDASEQDNEQMGTSLFSWLRSTKYISDSYPENRIIMTESTHAIEPCKTLTTSKDEIEPLVSHNPSDTKSKDSTLPTCSCSPDEKGTIFLPSSLKSSDTQNKANTLSTTRYIFPGNIRVDNPLISLNT